MAPTPLFCLLGGALSGPLPPSSLHPKEKPSANERKAGTRSSLRACLLVLKAPPLSYFVLFLSLPCQWGKEAGLGKQERDLGKSKLRDVEAAATPQKRNQADPVASYPDTSPAEVGSGLWSICTRVPPHLISMSWHWGHGEHQSHPLSLSGKQEVLGTLCCLWKGFSHHSIILSRLDSNCWRLLSEFHGLSHKGKTFLKCDLPFIHRI